jgi:hypothetical protein
MIWEEGVLPERSERFSARRIMAHVPFNVVARFMLYRASN